MPLGSFGVRRCSEPSRGLRGGARVPLRPVLRSPLRSYRPAPIIPSTSASISNCSTASATARRKSPSPVFSSSSANPNLSSVIGSSPALQVKVLQLHLSRSAPMTTSTPPQPTLRINLKTPPRAWTLTAILPVRLYAEGNHLLDGASGKPRRSPRPSRRIDERQTLDTAHRRGCRYAHRLPRLCEGIPIPGSYEGVPARAPLPLHRPNWR